MNTKTILAISIAAAFMVSTMGVAYAAGHVFFDGNPVVEVKSNAKGTNERIKVHFDVTADIPVAKQAGAFGYGVFTGGEATENVLVLVTHPGLTDSDHQDETSGFHTHVLDVKDTTGACTNGFDAEVDLEGSGMNKGFDLDADWEIDGKTAWIGFTPTKRLNDSTTVDAVVSFTITAVDNGGLHLCMDIKDSASP